MDDSERRSLILVNPGLAPKRASVSTMYTAYRLNDPDEIMPPGKDHEPLKADEIAVLRAWIAEGAVYQPHWAFVAPKRGGAASIDGRPLRLSASAGEA